LPRPCPRPLRLRSMAAAKFQTLVELWKPNEAIGVKGRGDGPLISWLATAPAAVHRVDAGEALGHLNLAGAKVPPHVVEVAGLRGAFGAGCPSSPGTVMRVDCASPAKRTQRAGTGSDDGRHSRLISP
jgi:hypothetical protein